MSTENIVYPNAKPSSDVNEQDILRKTNNNASTFGIEDLILGRNIADHNIRHQSMPIHSDQTTCATITVV